MKLTTEIKNLLDISRSLEKSIDNQTKLLENFIETQSKMDINKNTDKNIDKHKTHKRQKTLFEVWKKQTRTNSLKPILNKYEKTLTKKTFDKLKKQKCDFCGLSSSNIDTTKCLYCGQIYHKKLFYKNKTCYSLPNLYIKSKNLKQKFIHLPKKSLSLNTPDAEIDEFEDWVIMDKQDKTDKTDKEDKPLRKSSRKRKTPLRMEGIISGKDLDKLYNE